MSDIPPDLIKRCTKPELIRWVTELLEQKESLYSEQCETLKKIAILQASFERQAQFNLGNPVKVMGDYQPINANDILNSQVGYGITNSQKIIQEQLPGELKTLLTQLELDVKTLIPKIPVEKRAKAEKNLATLVIEATSAEPDREWYSVSSKGLLEASAFVKDLTGNIAGTIGSLTKLLGLS